MMHWAVTLSLRLNLLNLGWFSRARIAPSCLGRGLGHEVRLEPVVDFAEHVQHVFLGGVRVRFEREQHEPTLLPQTLQSLIEALALHREGAWVVVGLSVDQQQRPLDLICVHEGRHGQVRIRSLPQRPFFRLEPERGKEAVVGSRAADPDAKRVGVRQQIRSHEASVGVTADAHTLVAHPAPTELFHRSLSAGDKLGEEVVVLLLAVLADDGHGGVVEDCDAADQEHEGRGRGHAHEAMWRAFDLGGAGGVLVLARVGPEDGWNRALSLVVARREVQHSRELHAVVALVLDELLADAEERGLRVREEGDLLGGWDVGAGVQSYAALPHVRWVHLGLAAGEDRHVRGVLALHDQRGGLVRPLLAPPDPDSRCVGLCGELQPIAPLRSRRSTLFLRLPSRCWVEQGPQMQKWPITSLGAAGAAEECAALGVSPHQQRVLSRQPRRRRAWVVVHVVHGVFEERPGVLGPSRGVELPEPNPASLPLGLAHQCNFVIAPRRALQPPFCPENLYRLAVLVGDVERVCDISVRDFDLGIAVVLRFEPV
mmetsp:Transcript_46801/g.111004  ORF Transcript_46801/g.111004 Transcript_46801/m.111004 type:complete len:541 (+) Transcript_46801:204-1826(+)